MKYRSSNPVVRGLLDRPRWHEWLQFEIDHIKSQCPEFGMTFSEFKPDALEWSYYHDACLKSGSHEIVELLSRMAEVIPVKYHRYLHRGLTSSNVIDSCDYARFKHLFEEYCSVYLKLYTWGISGPVLKANGFTHGKRALLTTIRNRHSSALCCPATSNHYKMRRSEGLVVKAGPVGNDIHRQCLPRYWYNDMWSALVTGSAGLSQLALDYRFYATGWLPGVTLELQGTTSSAMPGKNNPSDFERINSLDLLIRGIVCSLMQTPPQWLERDLVHSALERENIDRLWEYAFYQLEEMTRLVKETKIVVDPSKQVSEPTYDLMNRWLDDGKSWSEARKLAASGQEPISGQP